MTEKIANTRITIAIHPTALQKEMLKMKLTAEEMIHPKNRKASPSLTWRRKSPTLSASVLNTDTTTKMMNSKIIQVTIVCYFIVLHVNNLFLLLFVDIKSDDLTRLIIKVF